MPTIFSKSSASGSTTSHTRFTVIADRWGRQPISILFDDQPHNQIATIALSPADATDLSAALQFAINSVAEPKAA